MRVSSAWALVDETDYESVNALIWSLDPSGYAHRMQPVAAAIRGRVKRVAMHRFILSAPDGVEVDHINGTTLDNRRSNLRLANRAQNIANTGKGVRASSRFKGVWRNVSTGRWNAMICVHGERRWLGSFLDEQDAARAYDAAAMAAHGEFARINLRPSGSPLAGGC